MRVVVVLYIGMTIRIATPVLAVAIILGGMTFVPTPAEAGCVRVYSRVSICNDAITDESGNGEIVSGDTVTNHRLKVIELKHHYRGKFFSKKSKYSHLR